MPTLSLSLSAAAFAATLFGATATQAAETASEKPQVSVTNTQAQRVAYCTVLVDSHARTKLAIRPGKTWSDSFDPRREVLLVCDRATSLKFGPLKAGIDYRLVEAPGAKIQLAEGGA